MIGYSIKKIIAPVDLSETSLNALHTAACLAKKHDATLEILNVAETSFDVSEEATYPLFSSHTHENVLSALTGSIGHTHDISSRLVQKKGNLAESIISSAISTQADLIVMGTHGASGIRENFIGTNTYQVIKYSTCPVLIIPPKRKFSSFKRMLFPIRPIAGALLPYEVACHFLSPNSTLDILGVTNLRRERESGVLDKIANEIDSKLTDDKIKVNKTWGMGISISDDILQFAQSNNSELITLTAILDAVSKPNFIGPYSQKIIHQSRIPLLCIKKNGVSAFA